MEDAIKIIEKEMERIIKYENSLAEPYKNEETDFDRGRFSGFRRAIFLIKEEIRLRKEREENSNIRYNVLADVGERLLPCPFCGAIPEFTENSSGILIKCMNDECGVHVFTEGRSNKEIAMESWNERANVS